MNQAMEGLEGLPEAQKQELMQKIEEMQVRDRSVQPTDRNDLSKLSSAACAYLQRALC